MSSSSSVRIKGIESITRRDDADALQALADALVGSAANGPLSDVIESVTVREIPGQRGMGGTRLQLIMRTAVDAHSDDGASSSSRINITALEKQVQQVCFGFLVSNDAFLHKGGISFICTMRTRYAEEDGSGDDDDDDANASPRKRRRHRSRSRSPLSLLK